MRKLFPLIFIIAIAGCTKEINSGFVNASNKTQTNASIIAADTYLPLTEGTYWKYRTIADLGNSVSKLTVTSVLKKINSKNYIAIEAVQDNNTDTIYYNQTQHDYYLYTDGTTDASETANLEILFLKDNARAGTEWTQAAGSAGGVKLKCYGKILETNTSLKIGDTTYENVIHSYVEIRKPLLFFSIVVAKQDYYVAKNTGIIKNVSTALLPVVSTTTSNIIGYDIK